MKHTKSLSVFSICLLVMFLLTFSLAVPILYRPFYYANADRYAAETGYTKDVIIEAYDQVLDYLVYGAEFGTGVLKSSQNGAAHFADCRTLFRLDFILLGVSAVLLAAICFIRKKCSLRLHRFRDRGICFWSMLVLTIAFSGIVLWALVDFSSLFTAFHKAFFPGKDNWIFDPCYDEIINILPLDFWMLAGALVVGLCMGLAAVLAVIEEKLYKRKGSRRFPE